MTVITKILKPANVTPVLGTKYKKEEPFGFLFYLSQLIHNIQMMKYYEMHEDAYCTLQKQGYITWDRLKNVKDLFSHDINIGLKEGLPKFIKKIENPSALDLGTGAGTVAIFLQSIGFKTTGYDVSKTAIQMAKANAEFLNLAPVFIVKDINDLIAEDKFDLIVDSSFLHCIVPENEREKMFDFANKSLETNGLFFIHTMIESNNMSEMLNNDYLILEDEILWSTGKNSWDMDWKTIQGKKVFPHRRIRTLQNLEKEIDRSGFKIISKKINSNQKNPDTYLAWLMKK